MLYNTITIIKKQINVIEIQIKSYSEIGHLREFNIQYKIKTTLYEKELKKYSIQIGHLISFMY